MMHIHSSGLGCFFFVVFFFQSNSLDTFLTWVGDGEAWGQVW